MRANPITSSSSNQNGTASVCAPAAGAGAALPWYGIGEARAAVDERVAFVVEGLSHHPIRLMFE